MDDKNYGVGKAMLLLRILCACLHKERFLRVPLNFPALITVVLSIATLRLQDEENEDHYEYEFSVLSTRCRFGGRKLSKCACSELKTRTRSRPRTPI